MKHWLDLLKKAFASWNDDKALRLSAALAYYAVFSIAPLLVITLGIAGLIWGQESLNGELYGQLKGYVGAKAAEGLQSMVQSASKPSHGIVATIVGSVTLLLGASGVMGELKDALNTIWEVKPKPGGSAVMSMIREKFLNFGMVIVIGFLLMISLVLSAAVAGLSKHFGTFLALPPAVWAVAAFLISFGVITVMIALIFKILPDARILWKDVWLGAALTAILFEIGKTALAWYLGLESTSNSYGAAASVVLLLLWVYYASCILFFGAEFTQVYAESKGHIITPDSHAERVNPDDRFEQGLPPPQKPAKSPALAKGSPGSTATPQPATMRTEGKAGVTSLVLGGVLALVGIAALVERQRTTSRGKECSRNDDEPSLLAEIATKALKAGLPVFVKNLADNVIGRSKASLTRTS